MTQESRPTTQSDELLQRETRVWKRINQHISNYFMSINRQTRREIIKVILSTLDTSKPVSDKSTVKNIQAMFFHMTEPSTLFSMTITNDDGDVIFYIDDFDDEAPSEILNRAVELMKKHSANVTVSATHCAEFVDVADPDGSTAVADHEETLIVFKP